MKVDKFLLDLYPLGMLTKVRVGPSGKGSFSWLLDKVVVTVGELQSTIEALLLI